MKISTRQASYINYRKDSNTSIPSFLSNASSSSNYSSKIFQKTNKKSSYGTVNSFIDCFKKITFQPKPIITSRRQFYSNSIDEYLNSINNDWKRFKNEERLEHTQENLFQAQKKTCLAQQLKKQHSWFYNFLMIKSCANINQRQGTYCATNAFSHNPENKEYKHVSKFEILGRKIQTILSFDTNQNKELMNDFYSMRTGQYNAGKIAQMDILCSHLSTLHISPLVSLKLMENSGGGLPLLSIVNHTLGLVGDGRLQMNVNILQDVLVDGMIGRLSNHLTNPEDLNNNAALINTQLEKLNLHLMQSYGEINSLKIILDNTNDKQKKDELIYKINILSINIQQKYCESIFEVLNIKKLNNKYQAEYKNMWELDYLSDQEIELAKQNNQNQDFNQIIALAISQKIELLAKNIKNDSDKYEWKYRGHINNFKEIFYVHFYQNIVRLAGAAGHAAAFSFGMPALMPLVTLTKGAFQLLTSGFDEIMRYNYRMSTYAKDSCFDFLDADAIKYGLPQLHRDINPVDWQDKLQESLFSNNAIDELNYKLNALEKILTQPMDSSQKNSLELSISELKDKIALRKKSKETYINNINSMEGVFWSSKDYDKYLLLKEKVLNINASLYQEQNNPNKDLKAIEILEKLKIDLKKQISQLKMKNEENSHQVKNKILKAKVKCDALKENLKDDMLYKKNNEKLDMLKVHENFLDHSFSISKKCSKNLNTFKNINLSFEKFEIRSTLMNNNSFSLLNNEKQNAIIDKIYADINIIKSILNGLNICNVENYIEAVNYLNNNLSSYIKANKNQIKSLSNYVDRKNNEVNKAKLEYAKLKITYTSKNIRRADNALARCAIRKDIIKSQLKPQTLVREEQCDKILNNRLTHQLDKVKEINYKINKLQTNIYTNKNDYFYEKDICFDSVKVQQLKEQLIIENKILTRMIKDIFYMKKSILFQKREKHPTKPNVYIAKDSLNNIIEVPDEWQFCYLKISTRNLWIPQIFTDDVYFNYHASQTDFNKPGEFLAQMGYRFFNLPGRFAIPFTNLATDIVQGVEGSKEMGFSGKAFEKDPNFDAKMLDLNSHLSDAKIASQPFSAVCIPTYILGGIWQLKYNKQYFAKDKELLAKLYSLQNYIQQEYMNLNSGKKINFAILQSDSEMEKDIEIKKIEQLLNHFKQNYAENKNSAINYIAWETFCILKSSQDKNSMNINDNFSGIKLPEEIKLLAHENDQELCLFKLTPKTTDYYTADSMDKHGKFRRTRTTFINFPKRVKQLLPEALFGVITFPYTLIKTRNTKINTIIKSNNINNLHSIITNKIFSSIRPLNSLSLI